MKRKFLSLLLTLLLCAGMALPVLAASDTAFVVDELGYLTENQIAQLNAQAEAIYENCGVGIFFVFTTADTLANYDVSALVGDMEDYYVMLENNTSWYTFAGGRGKTIDAAGEAALRAAYDREPTYMSGVEAYLNAASGCYAGGSQGNTAPATGNTGSGTLVYDEANLLSHTEETGLNAKLQSVSRTYNAQIVVVTLAALGSSDIDGYIEYLYDSMGFGYGSGHDGVLLLVAMDVREYRILSNGLAADAISVSDIDAISEAIVSDLSDGDFVGAFDEFADQCAYYLDGHINGFPFDFGGNLMIALVIGAVAGVVVAFILKGQLKSVRKQNRADDYVKAGSMQITNHSDLFLYRNISRTKKQTSSSSRSGGSSRNIGGGSF